MKTRAAILWEVGKDWSVEEIDLDPPRRGEVLVSLVGSGLCHSDEHLLTGDLPRRCRSSAVTRARVWSRRWARCRLAGARRPGRLRVHPGLRSVPVLRHRTREPLRSRDVPPRRSQITDHTARHHAEDTDLGLMCLLGTFAERTVVNEASCIKVDPDVPLDKACLLGCGVVTGWGSAVYAGEVAPGDDVVVVGIGGIGINAVQGANLAGAQPHLRHRSGSVQTREGRGVRRHPHRRFARGSTPLIRDETQGRMANQVIMTMAVGDGTRWRRRWRSPPSGVGSWLRTFIPPPRSRCP